MIHMLVVDDEAEEREGILFLLHKYGFNMETGQAPNGKAALDYLKNRAVDILFTDAACREYIGRGMVTVDRDVLLSIPDESIVPYNIESMVSAICVSGTYLRNNVFELEICVTVVLKVLAKVEVLVPSYGYCEVPPCEEFADSVCDEFFSLPLFPQAVCDEDALRARNVSCTCGNYASSTGLGCATTAAGMGCAGTCGCKC